MVHNAAHPASDPDGRLRFETLISDISARLIRALPADVMAQVESALLDIRLFFRADRCGLLMASPDYQEAFVYCASYADGVAQVPGNVNLVALYPWGARQLLEHRVPVAISRLADLPVEAATDRASFEAMGTQSQLTVPVVIGDRVTHMLVIQHETEERQWQAELTSRLRVLGEMMAGTIQRAEASEALRVREEALKTSERRLTLAAAAGRCGLWEFDAVANRLWMMPERRDLYGLSDGTYATQEQWLQAVHPDDRDTLAAQLNDLTSSSADFSADYRVLAADGRVRCMRASGQRGADGRLLGVSVDITEQREREEALKQAHEELHRLRDRLEEENVYLRKVVAPDGAGELIAGRSPAILRAVDLAAQVAQTSSTVLLIGETGTGKERFAEFIHRSSPRRNRHMVRVNCSAIPSALIESELFGRERGAYTGALTKQIGRFELAQGSTLFLDEIGDLPMDVQVKLLRVLQERTIERLGSPTPIDVDVRIIAATNRDLEASVRAGTFRADLYYRLNVFPIVVPPLRERREDIPQMVEVLVDELGDSIRKRFDAVDRASLDELQRYDFPGNVRELRNVLERAMILATGPTLRVVAPHSVSAPEPVTQPGTPGRKLKELERDHILRVLTEAGWRVRGSGAAAEILGVKPTSLEARMARLGIQRPTRTPQ